MDIAILLKPLEGIVSQEFDKYKKYVSSGNFYQQVADEYNNSLNPRKKSYKRGCQTLDVWGFLF